MKISRSPVYYFTVLIIVLCLLEVFLRLSGIYKTYTEKIQNQYFTNYDQNYPTWYRTWGDVDTFTLDHGEFRYKYTLNRYGIREREVSENDTNAIRLFTFGDSFTEGVGASYENTWPRQIEKLLEEEGLDACVYNLGMSGNDPFYNLALLRDKFLDYHPTHVIFGVNDSDFDDYLMRGGLERFRDDGTTKGRSAPWFHPGYRKSHVIRLVVHLFGYDRALIKKSKKRQLIDEATGQMIACLDSTQNLLKAENIRFLVMAHDTPKEICNPGDRHRIDLFSEAQLSFNFIPAGPKFREAVDPKKCYDIAWRTDGHYNADGYALLGDVLYQSIDEKYPGFWNLKTPVDP